MLRCYWPSQAITWQSRHARAGYSQIDILPEPERLADATSGKSAVLCLAGVISPIEALDANTDLALAALRAAERAGGVPVLLCSSAAVYGRCTGVWHEEATPDPISPYGQAKLRMERTALEEAARLGVPVTILRIGNIAGIDAILGNWRPGFALDRDSRGFTPLRSYVGPGALAQILESCLRKVGQLPDVLNIAQPKPVAFGDLLDAAGLAWTPRVPDATFIKQVVLSTERLARIHHFANKGSAAAIVADWQSWKNLRGGT